MWVVQGGSSSCVEVLRHSGCSLLPEVGVVLKTGDQGSLEAVVDWIEQSNRRIRDSPVVSPFVEASLAAALGAEAERHAAAASEQEKQQSQKQLMEHWKPLRIVRSGVGPVTPSDVSYAQLTKAILLAFGAPLLDTVEQVNHIHIYVAS